MPNIPREEAERELRARGCETDSNAGHPDCGLGQWWLTGAGSEFFIPWADETGAIRDRNLARVLRGLILLQ